MAQNNNNFFNPFEQMSNMFNFETQRKSMMKNMEAMTKMNQVAVDCSRDIARRVSDMVQQNTQSLYNCSKDAFECSNITDFSEKNRRAIEEMSKRSMECAKEAAEVITRAVNDIYKVSSERFQAAAPESKTAA